MYRVLYHGAFLIHDQERKMELNQAIIKMQQGGSADGILQVCFWPIKLPWDIINVDEVVCVCVF